MQGAELFSDSALGRMNGVVLQALNGTEDTTAADWEQLLDPVFITEVTADELAEVINSQIRPAGPFTVEDYAPVTDTESATTLSSDTARLSMQLVLDLQSGLMTGLVFTEAPEPLDPVHSIEELDEALDTLPYETTMMITEDGETLYEREADTPMPLASTSKLYVLYALIQAIERGDADFADTLTLTDELRSLPSGELQEEPTGYQLSVEDAAQLMISISDNTATDMLIDYLGREAVEQAVIDTGHQDPDLLTPFLTTGDLFALRWEGPELGERYLQADEQEKRDILNQLAQQPLQIGAEDVIPTDNAAQSVQWYASASDIASLHEALAEARDEHPELTAILTTNPGLVKELPQDPWWDEIAFKGGSVFESLSGSWTLRDSHTSGNGGNRQRSVVLLSSSEDAAQLQSQLGPLFGLAQDAFSLKAPAE